MNEYVLNSGLFEVLPLFDIDNLFLKECIFFVCRVKDERGRKKAMIITYHMTREKVVNLDVDSIENVREDYEYTSEYALSKIFIESMMEKINDVLPSVKLIFEHERNI